MRKRARKKLLRRLERNMEAAKQRGPIWVKVTYQGRMDREGLLSERREVESAASRAEKWEKLVLRRYVESGLTLDPVGEMLDDEGARFVYRIQPERLFAEAPGGELPFIFVSAVRGGDESGLANFRGLLKEAHVMTDQQRQIALDNIRKAMLVGEGQQLGHAMRD